MRGIATAVPESVDHFEAVRRYLGDDAVEKIIANTGVMQRRVSRQLCTSDLCFAAAQKLLIETATDLASIGALVFVSQTPDYFLPTTACVLQHRLGLPKQVAAFDVNQGCSGYIYGLWLAATMVASGAIGKVLLLVGDVPNRFTADLDRSTALLFGDAGTATLVERDPTAGSLHFVLGSDGSGAQNLIVPVGGARSPAKWAADACFDQRSRADGTLRSDADLYMNGAEIFTFTLREVPRLVSGVLAAAGWNKDEVGAYVFHQANRFMLRHLSKRMGIPEERVALSIEEFGNTSSASIPLTLTHAQRSSLAIAPQRMVWAGFGVGYSWGAVALEAGGPDFVLPPLIEVPDSAAQGLLGLEVNA